MGVVSLRFAISHTKIPAELSIFVKQVNTGKSGIQRTRYVVIWYAIDFKIESNHSVNDNNELQ